MKKKKDYVSPQVIPHRVVLETSLAVVLSVQSAGWTSDEIIGDDAGEGGDIYLSW